MASSSTLHAIAREATAQYWQALRFSPGPVVYVAGRQAPTPHLHAAGVPAAEARTLVECHNLDLERASKERDDQRLRGLLETAHWQAMTSRRGTHRILAGQEVIAGRLSHRQATQQCHLHNVAIPRLRAKLVREAQQTAL